MTPLPLPPLPITPYTDEVEYEEIRLERINETETQVAHDWK